MSFLELKFFVVNILAYLVSDTSKQIISYNAMSNSPKIALKWTSVTEMFQNI